MNEGQDTQPAQPCKKRHAQECVGTQENTAMEAEGENNWIKVDFISINQVPTYGMQGSPTVNKKRQNHSKNV